LYTFLFTVFKLLYLGILTITVGPHPDPCVITVTVAQLSNTVTFSQMTNQTNMFNVRQPSSDSFPVKTHLQLSRP